jgi:hypothetical protein
VEVGILVDESHGAFGVLDICIWAALGCARKFPVLIGVRGGGGVFEIINGGGVRDLGAAS